MNWKKLTRSALALVLVCFLFFNIAFVPARAVALADALLVTGENLMMGIIRNLGVSAGSEMADLNTAAQEAWAAYKLTHDWPEKAEDKVQMILSDPIKGVLMAPLDIVLWAREWIFDSKLVVGSSAYNRTYNLPACSSYAEAVAYAQNCPAGFIAYTQDYGTKYVIISQVSSYIELYDDGHIVFPGYAVSHAIWYEGCTSWESKNSSSWNYVYYHCTPLTTFPIISTNKDLQLEGLYPESVDFRTGYANWAATIQTRVNTQGQEQEYINLGLGQTLEETAGMDREQITAGATTIQIDKTQLGGTTWAEFKIWLASLFAPLQTALASIQDFFTFDADLSVYTAELTSFFPFCIPWDIYNMFTLFLAEPQAPHMEFDINFPYMDEPWHLVIDLAAWDTVAQILRSLELIAFCVGLGLFTREKFLRG